MREDEGFVGRWKSLRLPPRDGSAPAETAPASKPAQRVGRTGTFIDSGAIFEGSLRLRGDFRIDSEFRGELKTDGIIVVGPQGSIVGDVCARKVEIYGAVVGDIVGRRQVVLHSTARLHGNIETACLEIEKHAFFQGTTSMTRPQAAHLAQAEGTEPQQPLAASSASDSSGLSGASERPRTAPMSSSRADSV